jgi:large subunit ribosomal protein L4
VAGSTKKLFQQKGTGRARRGPIRSPLLRGGGKAFGPRNEANFTKNMPKKMRRAALFSCLSMRAKQGAVIGLENYPDEVKTKSLLTLLKKLPVTLGRRIVIVLAGQHRALELSARNIPRVKTLYVSYLNPEDLLGATNIIFLVDAVKAAVETFAKTEVAQEEVSAPAEPLAEKPKTAAKKPSAKKKAAPAAPKKPVTKKPSK